MYAMVPNATPGLVSNASVVTVGIDDTPTPAPPGHCFASPKSRIFACPRFVTKIFAGLISRCTIPFVCAASNASAISIPHCTNCSTGTVPCAMRSRNVCPSKHSIAMNARPPSSPMSYTVQMFG